MRLIHIAHSLIPALLLVGFAHAQNQAVHHYINAKNLPSNIVYDMEIGVNGLLLFATDNGVVQYNGSDFSEAAYFDDYKYHSVLSFYKHADESILATTCANKIIIAHPDSQAKSISYKSGNYCFKHIFKHNNKLFSYHNRYIYILNYHNSKLEIDSHRFHLPNGNFISNFTSFQSKLYAVVNASLFEYNPEQGMDTLLPNFNNTITATYCYGDSFYLISENSIYVSADLFTFNKLLDIDEHKYIGKIFPINQSLIYYEVQGEGLFLYDLALKKESLILKLKKDITFIKCDNNENLWVGTYGEGLFNLSTNLIKSIADLSNKPFHVTDIALNNKGRILIGTYNGLMEFDSSQTYMVNACEESRNKLIWEINFSKKLDKFIVSLYNSSNHTRVYKSKTCNDILYIRSTCNLVAKDMILASAWDHYIFQMNLHSPYKYKRFIYTEFIQKPNWAPDNRANVIAQTDTNDFLIGCNQGLYRWQNSNKNNYDKISKTKILQIKKDYQGEIWVVSPHKIFKLINNKLWEQHLSFYDNLTFTDIEFIPDSNLMFIGTKSGILFKTPSHEILINRKQGLLSQEITTLVYDTLNNDLWIGTTLGLHCLALEEIYKNLQQIPQPYFLLGNSIVQKDTLIRLTPTIKSFHIQYASLALFHSKDIKFRYRINKEDWVHSESQQLDLVLAHPGKYKLEIACSNAGLIWSDPIMLTLDKSPSFIQTLFFKIFILVCAIALTLLIALWRIRRLKRHEETNRNFEKQINEFKFKAFSASVNPHFIFNSLNSLQYLVNADKPKIVNAYIKSFARLLRLNIDDIDQTFVSLKREIERVNNYMAIEKMRFGDKINFEFDIDEKINLESTEVPGMVLQPFVENSIKHGFQNVEQGEINIQIRKENDILKFVIRDNGSGNSKNSSTLTGKGNVLVNKRLQVIFNLPDHQFVKVNQLDVNNTGYEVEISIPILSNK